MDGWFVFLKWNGNLSLSITKIFSIEPFTYLLFFFCLYPNPNQMLIYSSKFCKRSLFQSHFAWCQIQNFIAPYLNAVNFIFGVYFSLFYCSLVNICIIYIFLFIWLASVNISEFFNVNIDWISFVIVKTYLVIDFHFLSDNKVWFSRPSSQLCSFPSRIILGSTLYRAIVCNSQTECITDIISHFCCFVV